VKEKKKERVCLEERKRKSTWNRWKKKDRARLLRGRFGRSEGKAAFIKKLRGGKKRSVPAERRRTKPRRRGDPLFQGGMFVE